MISIETSVDDQRRRIDVVIGGPIAGAKVGRVVSQLFLDRPELTAYDILFDLRAYSGDVEAAHLEPIATAYEAAGPDPAVKCRTAFVTNDPNFGFWAGAMDFQFPGRKHAVFQTVEAAEAYLGETAR